MPRELGAWSSVFLLEAWRLRGAGLDNSQGIFSSEVGSLKAEGQCSEERQREIQCAAAIREGFLEEGDLS